MKDIQLLFIFHKEYCNMIMDETRKEEIECL